MKQPKSMTRTHVLGFVSVLALGLSGCSADLKHATCGWSTSIPPNGDKICSTTYVVLNKLALAELHGDSATIRRYVVAPAVARRMIRFGQTLRARGLVFLRVPPNPELAVTGNNRLLVTLYLVGRDRAGKLGYYEMVEERFTGSSVQIIGDQSGEEW